MSQKILLVRFENETEKADAKLTEASITGPIFKGYLKKGYVPIGRMTGFNMTFSQFMREEEDYFRQNPFLQIYVKQKIKVMKPKVKLTGTDGNVFALIGKCQVALKKANMEKEAKEMANKCREANSYDEAIRIMMEYVDVSQLWQGSVIIFISTKNKSYEIYVIQQTQH